MNNIRTVLITGGGTGIGRVIALKFAQNGWNVFCHYFSSCKSALGLKRDIEKKEQRCELIQADLATVNGIEKIIDHIKKCQIDSLINNAGTYVSQKHFSELSYDDLIDTFTVNAFAPVLLATFVVQKMKKNNFGRIVNISSIAAKYGGSAYSVHYGCSKRALEGLTRALAKEGAHNNVLVNTIRPGVIDTDFHRKYRKDLNRRIELIPVKRMGYPEEVAQMVYFLGSEKNTFITNETISVAGGE